MEYWEDRNCSKAYLDLVDKEAEDFEAFEATGYSDEGLVTMTSRREELQVEFSKLGPEDFGLSEGDYFVDVSYTTRKLYRIHNGKLQRHSENDWWHDTNEVSLRGAMGLTLKGKWLRFREAPFV